jgi:hypothetical protein
MPSTVSKKALVPEQELPPFTVFKDGTFGYRVRYRIVSEDGNRFSHYSPIFTVKPDYAFERPAAKDINDFVIIKQGPYINVVWDAILVKNTISEALIKKATQYDLWLRWSRGESNASYVAADRVDGTLQGFIIPSSYTLTDGTVVQQTPTELSVEIYLRATVQSQSNTALLVYKIENQSIV